MLCDAPTNYLCEEECTRFIAAVPTTWDETCDWTDVSVSMPDRTP